MLEQFEDEKCVYLVPSGTGPVEMHGFDCSAVAPFVEYDHLSTGHAGWDPGNWWRTGIAFEIFYQGTNTAGEDLWTIEDPELGVCLAPNPWTTRLEVSAIHCANTPDERWIFDDPVVPGNVQLRNEATGLCMGPNTYGLSPSLATCGTLSTDFLMTSLELGTPVPGDDQSGDDEEDPTHPGFYE